MDHFKKLRPLVQLLPAAAVAAAVFLTLPATQPVLAEVPQRLTAVVEPETPVASEPEAAEEDPLPTLPYADGVYTGSSRGYGGQVKVQVTMENGHITAVEILSASHETSAFLKRASRLVNTVVTEQTWEVDAVSEATYTSRGILGAVQNALTGEEVINPAPPKVETPAAPPVVEEIELPSTYRDGVYTASARGFGGDITVQVTVQGDAITDITILDHSGETSSYFTRARRVVGSILEAGTPEVDTVSGATYSSTGILNAVKAALVKAANDPEAAAEPEVLPETPAETPAEQPQPEEPAASEPVAPEQPAEQDDWQAFLTWAQDVWDSVFSDQPSENPSASPQEASSVAAEPQPAPEETPPAAAESTAAAGPEPASEPAAETAPAETPGPTDGEEGAE